MNFTSDNITGASAKILDAIVAANDGTAASYGHDEASVAAERRLSILFERELAVFLVATGTASNALALAALAPPGTAIFCHEEAHVIDDESGAPEFFSGGGKLVGIPGPGGKITPGALATILERFPRDVVRQVPPAALSLSQATESGTIYEAREIATLTAMAREAGVATHMDGARFANALVELGLSPAEMTWKAGIDVLSFGATKNGALACEAVIVFDPVLARGFAFRRKRGGHTLSKGRLLGAQMKAYLADDHWLDLATRANRAAARLAAGLAPIPGLRFPWTRGANEVFVILPRPVETALLEAGAKFYPWSTRSVPEAERPSARETFVRLVCSFATQDAEIDRFIETAAKAAATA